MRLLAKAAPVILLVALFCGAGGARAGENGSAFVPLKTPVRLPAVLLHQPETQPVTLASVLKDREGQGYTLLHLWASACRACIGEMRQLDRLHGPMAEQGFSFLFVAMDPVGDQTVPAFFRRHEIKTIRSYIDKRAALLNALQPPGLPVTYLLTPQGEAIAMAAGSVDWTNLRGL